MLPRSQRKLMAMRSQRKESKRAARRHHLMRKYPHIAPVVWSNMGEGLIGGVGGKALREWLRSVDMLARMRV